MTESLIRAIDLKEVKQDTREFVGTFAPYDEQIEFNGKLESYARGLFNDAVAEGVQIYVEHNLRDGVPAVGTVLEITDTDTGAQVRGKLFANPAGNKVYDLLKSGEQVGLSANFIPTQMRTADDVTVYEKAELLEISIVARGAYPSALITEVRSALEEEISDNKNTASSRGKDEQFNERSLNKETTNNMDENVINDVSELRSELENVQRELAVVREGAKEDKAGWQYRSAGELFNALAKGDDAAKSEVRAYTGSVLADNVQRPQWVDRALQYVNANRIGYNLFNHAPLISQGMSFTVPVFDPTSIVAVGVQANEGDLLTYGKVKTSTVPVTVQTLGGYIDYSKQVKDRGTIDYVNTAVELLGIDYARKVNNALVTAVTGATGVNTGTAITLSSSTFANWMNWVDEGVAAIGDNTGLLPEFAWVSRDVWYKLKGYTDTTGRPLMELNQDGTNTIGSANVVGVSGRFLGLTIVVDPALPAKTAIMGNGAAATVYESPGAPFELAQQDITHLTEQIALYGYVAYGVLLPKALYKATIS